MVLFRSFFSALLPHNPLATTLMMELLVILILFAFVAWAFPKVEHLKDGGPLILSILGGLSAAILLLSLVLFLQEIDQSMALLFRSFLSSLLPHDSLAKNLTKELVVIIILFVIGALVFPRLKSFKDAGPALVFSVFWGLSAAVVLMTLIFFLPGICHAVGVLDALTGAVLGWFLGIYLSPHSKQEEEAFSGYKSALVGLLSGVVLTKAQTLLSDKFKDGTYIHLKEVEYFLIFWVSVGVCAATVYNSRAYGESSDDSTPAPSTARIGTWKLNLGKSKFAGPPPTNQTHTYEVVGKGQKCAITGLNADESLVDCQYTANFDSKDYPVTGTGRFADTIALKEVDRYTVAFTCKEASKVILAGSSTVSNDGKLFTITGNGTDATGRPYSVMAVYDKQ